MCGISGIWTLNIDPAEARRATALMTRALAHRGPDDEGVEQVSRQAAEPGRPLVVFGHRRLAILDLSAAGHQPMSDPVAGNWITFNGEIYNFLELRADLEKLGHRFVSSCDTEVILKAYAEWGVGCWCRLRGMFAFGLWDEHYRELHLVRDHLGVKPLYFSLQNKSLVFASEVRALLASGCTSRKLSADGLLAYLSYGSVQEPVTLIQGVESVQPGHFLTCGASGRTDQRCYWQLTEFTRRNSPRRLDAAGIYAQLEASVSRQLISDVPLGVFLSGGLDSTAIAALAVQTGRTQVKTFCIGTEEKLSDESAEAAATAKLLGTDHSTLVLRGEIVAANFATAINSYDQPSIDGINTYFVSKLVRDAGIKVAISGVGGDELFVGYGGFEKALRVKQLSRRLNWIPACLRKQLGHAINSFATVGGSVATTILQALQGNKSSYYFASRALFSTRHIGRLLVPEFSFLSEASLWGQRERDLIDKAECMANDVDQVSFFELQAYMLSTLLRDADQMSMAHGLELRVPFIDAELVGHVLADVPSGKIMHNRNKPLLVAAMGPLIPFFIAGRSKRGFSLPFQRWILNELLPDFRAHFNSDVLYGPWSRTAYINLWEDFCRGRVSWSRIISLYTMENWLRQNKISV